ncbi:uncharacterized protein LOC120125073 [Hibiscus syriacus]|uniref:uncharacterized protein LOC120125073 n=1 Tax=Hibiscus syriacus TaxID=106335 RepID=UPI001921FC92|nr:uncharacterized protein LOC120125073 [Hibiscus syriacus]
MSPSMEPAYFTFILVDIYFGHNILWVWICNFHLWMSKHLGNVGGDRTDHISSDFEGTYTPPIVGETAIASNRSKHFDTYRSPYYPPRAGAWTYAFQIMYQTSAGAVILTDSVFWLILFPLLTAKDYSLNFLLVCMHSVNVVFLVGDTILNCMPFPFFRIGYFVLWTGTFVVFQWIIHACINLWWPYPFLDLSSSYAPLWYMGVGLMHIPCYGIFALMIKLKDFAMWWTSPESFRKRT